MVEIPNVAGPVRASSAEVGKKFINPYNFVSTPRRDTSADHPLGDGPSASHGTAETGRFSARIPIRLTTRSPLLIPDQPRAQRHQGQPATMSTRRDRRGAALLNGSTVKGVLRAAYEAITNSRYGIFDERHSLPRAIRADAHRALATSPAIVRQVTQNKDGDTIAVADRVKSLRPTGAGSITPMPAVWLPVGIGTAFARSLNRAPWTLDKTEVHAWIHLQRHPQPTFHMWRVSDLSLTEANLPDNPRNPENSDWNADFEPVRVKGIIHWTDGRFQRKHDERLVVTEVLKDDSKFASVEIDRILIGPSAMREWTATIESYLRAHETESETEKRSLATYVRDAQRWSLEPGRTMHVICDQNRVATKVTPAMIGRDVFPRSPREVAGTGHLPARTPDELSPADRVFGWVAEKRDGREGAAMKGHLRVTAPRVVTGPTESVTAAPSGATWLTTLNGPKPSQYRFYAIGKDWVYLDNKERDVKDGFVDGHSLRGRKFYLPHADVLGESDGARRYWRSTNATQSVDVGGRQRFPEHVSVDRTKPNISVQVSDWVPVGTVFEAEIYVDNLTDTELGALLWLLAVPNPGVFTVGLGKPLGFGATRIDAIWDRLEISDGATMRRRYSSLANAAKQLSEGSGDFETAQRLIDEFDHLLTEHEDSTIIRTEVLNAFFGFAGLPVHYPRVYGDGNSTAPKLNGYEWWVANERDESNRYALEWIGETTAPTLPYLARHQGRQQRGGRGRR